MRFVFLTICTMIYFIFSSSCTKDSPKSVGSTQSTSQISSPSFPEKAVTAMSASGTITKLDPELKLKQITSHLQFLASLEKAVLNILLESKTLPTNQFDVLVYAFQKSLDQKPGSLLAYGCQKLTVIQKPETFEILNGCSLPANKIAEIKEDFSNKNSFSLTFLTPQWKTILGDSAALNPDRYCQFSIKDLKIETFECFNTFFSLSHSDQSLSLEELKIKKYLFKRNQKQELMIEGGWFKNLVEIKKVNLSIPLTGQISMIETELAVKDDFQDLQNQLLGLDKTPEQTTQPAPEQAPELAPEQMPMDPKNYSR